MADWYIEIIPAVSLSSSSTSVIFITKIIVQNPNQKPKSIPITRIKASYLKGAHSWK
jgi:hypothetical protein